MDYKTFNFTLDMGQPPAEFSPAVKALWWERKGYWDKAHEIVQNLTGKDAAWVHAYLHRKEGDHMNAAYWYDRAGKENSFMDHDEEFREMVIVLLKSI
jgi:hypothetical protein